MGQDQVHGTGGADLGTENTGTQNLISKADSISFGLKMMAVGERGPVIRGERYEGLVGRDLAPFPPPKLVFIATTIQMPLTINYS